MLLIMTWYWRQSSNPHGYGPETVNTWAAMMSRNLTIPHRLACVTDEPDGIDIDCIPLPKDFGQIQSAAWPESDGAPQCYRRLSLFSPDAEQLFGASRFVSMDMDAVITGNCDHLFDHDRDFTMFRGTSGKRPYNGSMIQMNAGARPDVYTRMLNEGQKLVKMAQSRYLGSDQAIISYVLGPGEQTWGEGEGVYAWSQSFRRRFRGHPPRHMSILFFPGHIKPWRALEYPFVRRHWHMGDELPAPDRAPFYEPETVYAYGDPKGWGRRLAEEAKGVKVNLIQVAGKAKPGSLCFVRQDQQGKEKMRTARMAKILRRKGCRVFPSEQECRWYDNKVGQHKALKDWMPETFISKSKTEAREWADTADYPFVSKLSEGASSRNVRLVTDREQAEAVISQQDYVYFQRLIPDQTCDYRVTIMGDYMMGLVRDVREGDFRASGSGSNRHMDFSTDRERQAAELCQEIARKLGICWTAFDVVFDGDTPLVLEMSCSWHWQSAEDIPLYTHEYKQTDKHGRDSMGILLQLMVSGRVGD